MLALQASIGAANDVADASIDLGHKPGKPLPRGVVRRADAMPVAALGLVLGLLLAVGSGVATVGVAAAGVALGYLYDLRLSRTVWSWLPLAAALPLVILFAWVGSTGAVPGAIAVLVPIGVVAGGGLALANGLADLERDAAAGVASATVRLGPRRAWLVHAIALLAAIAAAWWLGPRASGREAAVLLGMGAATLLLAVGVALAISPRASLRERGWELEAIAVATLGLAWVAGVASV
jgi:4-hydroxybenzoate polyprenyltransferase